MKIDVTGFKGMLPTVDPTLLSQQHAVAAVNTKLNTGTLKPFRAPVLVTTPTKTGTKQSIYRFAPTPGNDASGFWFHWTSVVDVVRGPVRGDTTERTYFTGDGVPKVTNNAIALTGGTNYPMNAYQLGIPAPNVVISVTKGGTAEEGATEADKRTWAYVATYVSAWGEEGPPSAPSASIDLLPGENVTVGNLGTAPIGNYNIATKRIYRTATDDATTEFYFLTEIPVSTTSIVRLMHLSSVVLPTPLRPISARRSRGPTCRSSGGLSGPPNSHLPPCCRAMPSRLRIGGCAIGGAR